MKRNQIKVAVIGGGAAGLAVAVWLACRGYAVVVFEKLDAVFQKQSGDCGGQARLHGGYFYGHSSDVAKAIHNERSLLINAPEVVVRVPCYYYIANAVLAITLAQWRAAGLAYHIVRGDRVPLSDSVRNRVTVVHASDLVIDTARLCSRLLGDLRRAGGQVICNSEVIGSELRGDRIRALLLQAPRGKWPFHCDYVVNVAGAALGYVAKQIDPSVDLSGCLELTATPVLRAPCFLTAGPQIIQAWGLLEHLAVIPVGKSRMVSIATRGGYPIVKGVPSQLPSLESESRRLMRLVAEAFDLMALADPQVTTYCTKAQLTHPALKAHGSPAANRLVTAVPGPLFGGATNHVICTPGKLGSCFHLGNVVMREVDEHFGFVRKAA